MVRQEIKTVDGGTVISLLPENEEDVIELMRRGRLQPEGLNDPDLDENELAAAGVIEPD